MTIINPLTFCFSFYFISFNLKFEQCMKICFVMCRLKDKDKRLEVKRLLVEIIGGSQRILLRKILHVI